MPTLWQKAGLVKRGFEIDKTALTPAYKLVEDLGPDNLIYKIVYTECRRLDDASRHRSLPRKHVKQHKHDMMRLHIVTEFLAEYRKHFPEMFTASDPDDTRDLDVVGASIAGTSADRESVVSSNGEVTHNNVDENMATTERILESHACLPVQDLVPELSELSTWLFNTSTQPARLRVRKDIDDQLVVTFVKPDMRPPRPATPRNSSPRPTQPSPSAGPHGHVVSPDVESPGAVRVREAQFTLHPGESNTITLHPPPRGAFTAPGLDPRDIHLDIRATDSPDPQPRQIYTNAHDASALLHLSAGSNDAPISPISLGIDSISSAIDNPQIAQSTPRRPRRLLSPLDAPSPLDGTLNMGRLGHFSPTRAIASLSSPRTEYTFTLTPQSQYTLVLPPTAPHEIPSTPPSPYSPISPDSPTALELLRTPRRAFEELPYSPSDEGRVFLMDEEQRGGRGRLGLGLERNPEENDLRNEYVHEHASGRR